VDHREKPGSPGDILEHHGVKGMRWGVRKEEETGGRDARGLMEPGKAIAKRNEAQKQKIAKSEPLRPGTPEFHEMVGRLTKTDHPQMLGTTPRNSKDGKIQAAPKQKHGLTKNQKMLLAFGAVAAAGAGYYAYQHYTGQKLPDALPRHLLKEQQQVKVLEGMKLPAKWDVSKLKDSPISAQKLGDLAAGDRNAKLLHPENLVVNTSRGYADILPKNGFSNPFAAEQHASITHVLEEMRDKYPAIRNMNVEVIPYSHVQGMADRNGSHMCVLSMRAGEARVMYNDLMDAPSTTAIRANRRFLPGLGKKNYVAYHEMGHLLAAAHGELPPAFDLISSKTSALESLRERGTWHKAEPLLHQKMFIKHGFKLSGYAATEPAEAMAELHGHLMHSEMRNRLTPDQIKRATAMFNEMGGVTG
jgi:hypothetical protein